MMMRTGFSGHAAEATLDARRIAAARSFLAGIRTSSRMKDEG
jgi:hypothetical protein